MKLIMSLIMVLAGCLSANAQMLWPIAGAETGEGLIYKPQQYIDDELVYDEIFITAEEGTAVVSPADGTISHVNVGLSLSMNYSLSYHSSGLDFDEMIEEILNGGEEVMYPEYLSGHVAIKLDSGYTCHISGLRGKERLKTGMRIHKGDTLGIIWKSYHKIREPHIDISISRYGKASDPMSPFGLDSSFIPPQEMKIPEHLTAEQAHEDLTVLFNAYEECYPSKYDLMTPAQDSLFQAQAYARIADGLSYSHFYSLVRTTTSAQYCHDSHLYLLTKAPEMSLYPNLNIFPYRDSLMVYTATKPHENLIRKRVVSINGLDAGYYLKRDRENKTVFDAENQSRRDARQNYRDFYGQEVLDTLTRTEVVFADGTRFTDRWMDIKTNMKKMRRVKVDSISYLWNMYAGEIENKDYKFMHLNDSTALFTLRTFWLDAIQEEEIIDSIKAYSGYSNMIIDLRNNYGGSSEVMVRLLTHLINSEPVKLKQYTEVCSNGKYDSFKHSTNYSPDYEIFKEYELTENGYCIADNTLTGMVPDSLVNYKGRIYIMTGENTCSAASIFASFLVRNNRAYTVGRETGSGYHWMTALKFVDIILPNSMIQVRIPLVKSVFDDSVTDRTPLGRGLMPDFEVPLTYEEQYVVPTDIILETTLDLIAQGIYLTDENPFGEIDKPSKKPSPAFWAVIAITALGILCFYPLIRRNNKKQ